MVSGPTAPFCGAVGLFGADHEDTMRSQRHFQRFHHFRIRRARCGDVSELASMIRNLAEYEGLLDQASVSEE